MDITWIPLIQYGSSGVHLVKKWPKVVKKWHFWAITAKPKSTFLPLECQVSPGEHQVNATHPPGSTWGPTEDVVDRQVLQSTEQYWIQ